MGTRVGMEHVQERLDVQLHVHKSHLHKYPYMWYIHYNTTLASLSQNTTHVGIFMWV